jgi:hypothetical protein
MTPQATGETVNSTRLSRLAGAGIVSSVALMIVVSAVHSVSAPPMPAPSGPLPVELRFTLSDPAVTFMLWAAAALGGAGVIAGLAAVARGARYPAWLMIGASFAAVVVLALLPPNGSTDTVTYASYGRMAALGHNPYLMTPVELARTGDPVGKAAAALDWRHRTSLYGPVATAEQWAAARLGGSSVTGIILWLKVWNALAFAGVALWLDRMLRSDPARRTRAHLLWTANPLVLWALIAGGHLDMLAAAAVYLGLTLPRTRNAGGRVALTAAAGAGMLVGVSADIMLTYLLFAPALLWGLRRRPAAVAAGAAGMCLTLLAGYLWAGMAFFRGFASRQGLVGADNFYQLISPAFQHALPPGMALIVEAAFAGLALLLLWRLPDWLPGMPAVRPALAVSIAWLFIWYYQLPWYDTMAIGLLAIYPASRLDWAVIGQFTIATFANLPGSVRVLTPRWDGYIAYLSSFRIMPLLLLVALVVLVGLCVSGKWDIAVRHAGVRQEPVLPFLPEGVVAPPPPLAGAGPFPGAAAQDPSAAQEHLTADLRRRVPLCTLGV